MKRTPLHYAAMSGNVDSVKLLIELGANINHKNIVSGCEIE